MMSSNAQTGNKTILKKKNTTPGGKALGAYGSIMYLPSSIVLC